MSHTTPGGNQPPDPLAAMDCHSFFIQNGAGQYVGWPMAGPWVGKWVFYEVLWPSSKIYLGETQPTLMRRVRPLLESEIAQIHTHKIMYFGFLFHPKQPPGAKRRKEELVEDALVIAEPSDFCPLYVHPSERKHNTEYQRRNLPGIGV